MKQIKGDLIKQCNEFDVIVHGCNCFHTMGAGIARTISLTWEHALEADRISDYADRDKLGSFTYFIVVNPETQKRLMVINAYTQYHWAPKASSNGQPPVDYEAIRNVMQGLKLNLPGRKFGIPMIGAGLAGGDWNKIVEIIFDELEDEDVTIVEYDPNHFGEDYSEKYTELHCKGYIQKT